MSWNYRVLVHKHNDELEFNIHEVLYDKHGTPDCYSSDAISVGGGSIDSLLFTINGMKRAITEPILWAGERWPQEFKYEEVEE
jgi:hypothetical protein